jgi:hypothetical protein
MCVLKRCEPLLEIHCVGPVFRLEIMYDTI